ILFEANEKLPIPSHSGGKQEHRRERGSRHFFLGQWKEALKAWEGVSFAEAMEPSIWRFLMFKAALKAGDLKKAEAMKRDLLDRPERFRPGEIDSLERFSRFDRDAEELLTRLRQAREER
ncbi:MAG: hypothetical protein ACYS47_17470, partial [Planctomycetota bacterium]